MTGSEDEAQQVVIQVIAIRDIAEICFGQRLLHLKVPAQLIDLAFQGDVAPYPIDGAVLGGGHQPGSRVVGDAHLRPPLQRDHQRVLCQILSQANIADDARQAADQFRRLDAPDGVDGAVDVGRRNGHERRRLLPVVGPLQLGDLDLAHF